MFCLIHISFYYLKIQDTNKWKSISFFFHLYFTICNSKYILKETKCHLGYMLYEHNEEMLLDNNQQA